MLPATLENGWFWPVVRNRSSLFSVAQFISGGFPVKLEVPFQAGEWKG